MKLTGLFHGITPKFIVSIFTTVSIIMVVLLLYISRFSSQAILNNLRVNSSIQTKSTVNEIEKHLAAVQKVPQNLAGYIEDQDYSEADLARMLTTAVTGNPEVLGAAIAFENGVQTGKNRINSFYIYKNGGEILSTAIGGPGHDLADLEWYQIPKKLGRPTWSEPYFARSGSKTIISTYSVPLYRKVNGEKVFIGVLTADISLKWLQELFDSIKIYRTGYAFMISRKGTFVTHPKKEFIMNETILSVADQIRSEQLRTIGHDMISGKTSIAEKEYHNVATRKLSWVSFSPVDLNGWSLGIVYPVDELMAPLNSLFRMVLVLSLVGLGILLLVVILVSRSMTSPVRRLAVAAQGIAAGSFDVVLPQPRSADEISELTTAFRVMQDALRQTIDRLKDANLNLEEYNRTLEEKVEIRTTALKDRNHQLNKAFEDVKTLSRIGQEITSTLNLESIFNKVYQHVNELFDAHSFVVMVLNEKEQTLDCRLAMENGEKLPEFSFNMSDKNRFAVWCVDNKQPVFINDVDEEYIKYISFRNKPKAGQYVSSILYLPLLIGERVIGAISVQSLKKHAYTQNHLNMFSNLATYAAIALDNAFAYDAVHKANQDLKEAQAQLIQAEKMASLGELTAGIAHEIKNPLNFINNFSELSIELVEELKEELSRNASRLDDKTVTYFNEVMEDVDHNVRKINEHGRRADNIVKGMLLHSRGKAGEKQKTNLNDLLAEYLNLAYHGFRAQHPNFNVKMVTDFDKSIGLVSVVPQNISRVFLNIINNACYSVFEKSQEKASSFNPTLTLSSQKIDDRIVITFRDNGKGIPKEVMEKIFNPFFTTKPAGSGTGLGLSLSYDIIVKEHSGEIRVDSEPNEFAEFTITLPISAG